MNERIRRARERALTLLHTGGNGTLFAGRDKKTRSGKKVKSGKLAITVPPRSVVLIEQERIETLTY